MLDVENNMDEKKRDIPIDEIDEYPMNEYLFGYQNQDFANEVIKEDGFHGAIEVCVMENGRYQILSGHRRYRACKANGYKTIPCIVNEYLSEEDRLSRVIRGNITHRTLTPLNYARCLQEYEKLLKSKKAAGVREKMAKFFNLSPAGVSRYLSINTLIPEFQELCDHVNFPYTNLLPITFKPKEIQRDLYHRLWAIAPDNNIAELSRNVIEQQIAIIVKKYEKEESDLQISPRVITVKDDVVMTDESSQPFKAQFEVKKQDEAVQRENPSDDVISSVFEQKNISESYLEEETEDEDLFDEPELIEAYVPKRETEVFRDKEINFYLDKIESLAKDYGSVTNKEKIIERLKKLIEIFAK